MDAARRTVRVAVPATSANLGPGFDCLGLALELRNHFIFTAEGWVENPEEVVLTVEAEGEGVRSLPRDTENLVYRAASQVFSRLHRYPARLALRLECAIPLGKGLGSSAAAIVGGVWGAAALCEDDPLPHDVLLSQAVQLEGHPDNVVPAVVGGFTLAFAAAPGEMPRYLRLPGKADFLAVVAVPSFSLRTTEARRRLPRQVPLADAVFNLGRTAAVVAGAALGDWEFATSGMEDRLHQPYRSPLIPGFNAVCAAARQAGAAASVLSGAGPSVLALVLPRSARPEAGSLARQAQEVGAAMEQAFTAAGVKASALVLGPAQEGVQVTREGKA